MFRKITLALAAATVVATAAIPTSASAHHWRHRHHHGVRIGIVAPLPILVSGPRCHVHKKFVHTKWGLKKRYVRHCV